MIKQNPYQKYMQQSVSTMTPGQMVVALYDKAHNSITRVADIVDTLDAHLKEKYEISKNLAAMYQYFRENLIQANVKKDAETLKMLLPFFQELRDAFAQASKGF